MQQLVSEHRKYKEKLSVGVDAFAFIKFVLGFHLLPPLSLVPPDVLLNISPSDTDTHMKKPHGPRGTCRV